MTLDAMRCFCAVVETGSFREAAARVFRSQPAVSQQVKSLERHLGHVLIDRSTGTPTAVGQLFYNRAKAILLATDSLAEEVADLDAGWSRDLRVGASDTIALYLLPDYVRAFSHQMPSTRLVLVSRSTDAVIAQVLQGELDLGIVTLPVSHAHLHEQSLWDLPLTGIAPRNHPLATSRRISLKHVARYPYLALEEQTRTGALLRDHFRKAGLAPQVVLDSGSFEVIKRYVAEGVGVSIVPEPIVTPSDALTTLHVPGLPALPIGIIWRRGAYRSRAAMRFLTLLEENR